MCAFCGGALASPPLLVDILKAAASSPKSRKKGFISKTEAMFYKSLGEDTIQCQLCPRRCTLSEGMRGFCRAREPHKGKHYSLVYGNPTTVHVDPIEKKPLFHFLPATTAFSIATAGCNFRCKYCQNWQIAQFPPEDTVNIHLPPKDVVNLAIKYGCPTIAYTYTEPSIFYEYMLETAKIARKSGIRNMYHSNGSLNPEPAEQLSQYLDGANIDLKGFTQKFYSEISEGFLKTVDDQKICTDCLFGGMKPIEIWPIGVVKNDKHLIDSDFGTTGSDISKITLVPNMIQFMKGLSDETHLTVIWYIHQSKPIKSVFKRGWDGKEVGMFASRTPHRLNPIGVSEVELLKVEGPTLTVKGLDAIDGTPIIDIKVGMESLKQND